MRRNFFEALPNVHKFHMTSFLQAIKRYYPNKPFPLFLCFPILFIFVLNTVAIVLFWYRDFFWFDMLTHALGGAWIGGLAIWYMFSLRDEKATPIITRRVFFISFLFTIFIGVFWEIFEVAVDMWTHAFSYSSTDGLTDLFFDSVGALLLNVCVFFYLNTSFTKGRTNV